MAPELRRRIDRRLQPRGLSVPKLRDNRSSRRYRTSSGNRPAARQREIGLRFCLGAGRWRLVRQLMTEGCLLAALGGGAGLLLAWWCLRTFLAAALLSALGRADVVEPALSNLQPDLQILIYTLLLSLASCLAFSLIPALRATHVDLVSTIKDESGGFGHRNARSRLRNGLVVAQMALCLVLLVAAGLLLRGLGQAQAAAAQKRVAEFRPTPELVHGVTVSNPQLAAAIRKAGWFSGKRAVLLDDEHGEVRVYRDQHDFVLGVESEDETRRSTRQGSFYIQALK